MVELMPAQKAVGFLCGAGRCARFGGAMQVRSTRTAMWEFCFSRQRLSMDVCEVWLKTASMRFLTVEFSTFLSGYR